MAAFTKSASNTYTRGVAVFLGDQTLGDLNVTFDVLTQAEFDNLVTNENDVGLCTRVIKAVGDIPVEGSNEVIKGEDAINLVLTHPACVAACAAQYMEDFKGRNFRNRGAKKGR